MSLLPANAWSQAQASLGLGIGTVRFPGGSSFSSGVVSPSLELESSSLAATLGGTIASLPHGIWASQGRADLWGGTPALVGGVHAGVELIGAGVTRTDGSWSAAAHGLAELFWVGRGGGIGFGLGPSAGWIVDEPSVTALHLRVRGWWRVGKASYAVNVEPTRFPDGWFTDANTGLTIATRRMTTSLWVVSRLSGTFGSKGAASATVQLFPHPNFAIEVSGGGYLSEPYQGLSRTTYVSAGVRLLTSRRSRSAAARAPTSPPLVPVRRGDSVVVRFRMVGAKSVAIAGDWNGWQPRPLLGLGSDLWGGPLDIPSGTHHFTLLVDGTDWVVPGGVAVLSDGMGGMVGLLLVP